MSDSIVVIGAGPGIGLHVAERFGREGFSVGLVARRRDNLDLLSARLGEVDITASVFPCDVTDGAALAEVLDEAQQALGGIEVVVYNPAPSFDTLATPRNITPDNAAPQFALTFGAITTVQSVLSGMISNGSGGILFTTAASAIEPIAFSANFAMAQAAIRNYVHSLHKDLRAEGIYVGMVLIAGGVNPGDGTLPPDRSEADLEPAGAGGSPSMPIVPAWKVADTLWELYSSRSEVERVLGDMAAVKKLVGE